MVHHDRVFGVTEVPDLQTLAHKLFHYTWSRCTGFQLGQYLLLNDSFFDESVPELAVFKITDLGYVKIESLTIWYMNSNENHVVKILINCMKSQTNYGTYNLKLENSSEHQCHLCL